MPCNATYANILIQRISLEPWKSEQTIETAAYCIPSAVCTVHLLVYKAASALDAAHCTHNTIQCPLVIFLFLKLASRSSPTHHTPHPLETIYLHLDRIIKAITVNSSFPILHDVMETMRERKKKRSPTHCLHYNPASLERINGWNNSDNCDKSASSKTRTWNEKPQNETKRNSEHWTKTKGIAKSAKRWHKYNRMNEGRDNRETNVKIVECT